MRANHDDSNLSLLVSEGIVDALHAMNYVLQSAWDVIEVKLQREVVLQRLIQMRSRDRLELRTKVFCGASD